MHPISSDICVPYNLAISLVSENILRLFSVKEFSFSKGAGVMVSPGQAVLVSSFHWLQPGWMSLFYRWDGLELCLHSRFSSNVLKSLNLLSSTLPHILRSTCPQSREAEVLLGDLLWPDCDLTVTRKNQPCCVFQVFMLWRPNTRLEDGSLLRFLNHELIQQPLRLLQI